VLFRSDLATGQKSPLFDDAKLLAAVNAVTGRLLSYEPERTVAGVRGRGYGAVLSPDLRYRAFNRSYNKPVVK